MVETDDDNESDPPESVEALELTLEFTDGVPPRNKWFC